MAFSPSPKTRYSFFALFSLSFLCLAFFFLFSKQVLEPSLSLSRDLWFHTLSLSTLFSHPKLSDPPTPFKSHGITPHLESTAYNSSLDANVGTQENLFSEQNFHKKCDLYRGKWVKDDGYPLYRPGSCPYIDEAYSCQENGRQDAEYMKWRWKPLDCDLPRFNATDFLERLRGKRLLLVGDSVNRNQFESMLCLLYEALPNKSRMYEIHGYKITKGQGTITVPLGSGGHIFL